MIRRYRLAVARPVALSDTGAVGTALLRLHGSRAANRGLPCVKRSEQPRAATKNVCSKSHLGSAHGAMLLAILGYFFRVFNFNPLRNKPDVVRERHTLDISSMGHTCCCSFERMALAFQVWNRGEVFATAIRV